MTVANLNIENSTFHGLQHLITKNKKNNRLIRIGWAFTIIASCIACVWLCFTLRSNFKNVYTITAVVSHTYEISKIPFPSIAICNVNKVSKSKFQHFKKILSQNNVSEDEADAFGKSLSSLLAFSTFDYYMYNNNTYENIFNILEKYNYTVDILMKELQQDCKKLLTNCYMETRTENCSHYFEMIRTGEGYCCAFNYRGIMDFLDEDNLNFSIVNNEPYHLWGYQLFGGVNVVYNVDKNDYLSPIRPVYGVSVLVGDPIDYPDVTTKMTTMEYNQLIKVEVTPTLVESASGLFYLDQDDRNCWMSEEVNSTEGVYSFQTCITRCRALAIFEMCGCIPFYYPRFGNDSRRKCRLIDNQCLRKNQEYFFSISSKESIGLTCNCKYQCSDYFYKVATYRSKIQHSAFYSGYFKPLKTMNAGMLSVYYPKISCSKFRTDIFMYWNDTLALYGGIVNFFIGGSILTCFEIIMYLFIRKYRTYNNRQQLTISQFNE